jgi:uncharacterized membrane protein YjjB (DUF3815 family)
MKLITISFIVVFGTIAGLGLWLIVELRNSQLPTVQVDSATGECLRVIFKDNRYGCNTLPKKHKIEYVAPYQTWQEEAQ